MKSLLKKSSVTYFKSLTPVTCYRASEVHKKDHGHHDKHDPHHAVDSHDHHHHVEDPNKPLYPGDITPKAFDEYKWIFQDPIDKETPYALHNLFATNSITKNKSFLKFLYDNLSYGKVEDTSDYFRPPKIHENSVFLYQSRAFANSTRFLRGTEALQAFAFVGLLKDPTLFIPIYGLFYVMMGKAAVYERCNRFVTRMDFLPHLEMVSFQKVTAFGVVYSKLVRTSDLEYVQYEELEEKENLFWGFNGSFDKLMIFRDKKSKEIFLFDRDGYWDTKGLAHELLN
eukprot:CAMPEP_0176444682 /NCGR_PEP_ID=MMETSP0127-20121128/23218_1 /TAXON_ID=938130 /ORGANISM="Platyophrya macrostoma, Strain WH" /LENGTH=283 /DNA_ID=CAMNT_0017830257 /DNA_START=36 /DNA_END=887 /DNA_ORIENTATION=+